MRCKPLATHVLVEIHTHPLERACLLRVVWRASRLHAAVPPVVLAEGVVESDHLPAAERVAVVLRARLRAGAFLGS